MKTSPIIKMLAIMLALGFFVIPATARHVTPILASIATISIPAPPKPTYHINPNNEVHQMVIIEITKPDKTKYEIQAPFMAVEMSHTISVSHPSSITWAETPGTNGLVVASNVTNYSAFDLECYFFNPYSLFSGDIEINTLDNFVEPAGATGVGNRPGSGPIKHEIRAVGCVPQPRSDTIFTLARQITEMLKDIYIGQDF